MNNGELLPVPQNKSRLPSNINEGLRKAGKITKYALLTSGFVIITSGAIAVAPIVAVPALVGAVYTGQKLLNNTLYKSYDDLAFVTRKGKRNTTKIFQDSTRLDITNKIKDYSNIEKAGFMQLQAIIGMTKFDRKNKEGTLNRFSTVSHGINRKTFKKLASLGYIENYEEEYKKNTHLVLPKLMFGNIKALKDKVEMYDINFNLSDKQLDINDEKLQKAFPAVFGKRGIIQKYGYEIIPDDRNQGLKIKYPEKNKLQSTSISKEEKEQKSKNFKEEYKDSDLTYQAQRENAQRFNEKTEQLKEKTKEDRFH